MCLGAITLSVVEVAGESNFYDLHNMDLSCKVFLKEVHLRPSPGEVMVLHSPPVSPTLLLPSSDQH